MKIKSPALIHEIELENLQLNRIISCAASVHQSPLLVLKRDTAGNTLKYILYMYSHIDSHYLRLKFFHRLDDFVTWFMQQTIFPKTPLYTFLDVSHSNSRSC